jgi:hypothetical protein
LKPLLVLFFLSFIFQEAIATNHHNLPTATTLQARGGSYMVFIGATNYGDPLDIDYTVEFHPEVYIVGENPDLIYWINDNPVNPGFTQISPIPGQYYDIKLVPFNLDRPVNVLKVSITYNTETIVDSVTIYYCMPDIQPDYLITGGEKRSVDSVSVHIVNYPDLSVIYHAGPLCIANDNEITSIEARLNTGPWTVILTPNPVAHAYFTDTVTISGFSPLYPLVPGFNTLYLRAKGNLANEYSEVVSVVLFYLDIGLGELPGPVICQYDDYYRMNGMPPGGRFRGTGIIGETGVFYPPAALVGQNTVWYYFDDEGIDDSVATQVFVKPLPDVSISQGDLEVCAYQYGTPYRFSLSANAMITGIEVTRGNLREQSDALLVVDWQNTGEGIINVHLVTDDAEACTNSKEVLVDIGYDKSPRDSAYMALIDRMLFCSDKSVNYYYWYWTNEVRDIHDSLLSMTTVPYYFLPFIPDNNDVYNVETAYDTLTGCTRRSHPLSVSNPSTNRLELMGDIGKNLHALFVYPNPVKDVLYLTYDNETPGPLTLQILDTGGKIIHQETIIRETGFLILQLRLNTLLKANGIYCIRLFNDKTSKACKILYYQN